MKHEVYLRIYAWPHSVLNMMHHNGDDASCIGNGYYIHSSGYAVRVYYDDGYGRRAACTSLDMNYGGITYSKTIDKLYTDRGLQLLCARFVSDVLSGKVERLVKEQKK